LFHAKIKSSEEHESSEEMVYKGVFWKTLLPSERVGNRYASATRYAAIG